MKANTFFVYLFVLTVATFGFYACESTPETREVQEETSEAMDATEDAWMAERTELERELKVKDAEFNEHRMTELDQRIETAEASTKAELEEERMELKRDYNEFQKGMGRFGDATKDTWNDMKKEVNDAANKVESDFERAFDNDNNG